ncbi:reticulon-like protein B18 isoform X1 [Telopea speciosissima]|uniref:reticulon-like protein B18 isoform X1 n=1 Tax=Telopea speciosissima TaxID=54955 RepID=UPI001CC7157C|nr:reticulon-like protein B18 isoform X1 [Telopea speciosissima]
MHAAMDSTPPSHQSGPRLRRKSVSPLPPIGVLGVEAENLAPDPIPSTSPQPKKTPSPSRLSLRSSTNSLPLQELLLLSPSPLRRSRTRLLERTEMAEEVLEPVSHRRRCKSRAASMALLACPSPRNARRTRKRMELEIREERDVGLGDEVGKPRRRKQSNRSRRENLSLVPLVPCSSLSPRSSDEDQSSLDRVGQLISDLIMWKDVARSSLWFGFGSLCFLSSCFTGGLSFSLFSVVSQLGLLFLGLSFFCNSLSQRNKESKKQDFKLKEDDIIRAARVILPAANLAIAKTREVFSGDPSMTLKVAPILLFGAEYGHFITIRKLIAIGFFVSFTAPKFYSCYSEQINKKVEYLRYCVWDAWGACSHKKIVAASAATVFWNLSSVKTRVLAAFISVVTFRYYQQHMQAEAEEEEADEQRQQHQALVVAEKGSPK